MFAGLTTALITPFLPTKQIDEDAFASLVQSQDKARVDGILIGGTTGESPTLTSQEIERLFSIAKEVFSSGFILVGAGSNCTQKTIANLKQAKRLGADGALVVTPYYNKPCQNGVIAHYEACSRVGIPIMQYHIPGRTHVTLTAQTLKKILSFEHVVACKESSQNLELTEALVKIGQKPILCGDDAHALSYLGSGARGVVSVLSNLFPQEWMRIVHQQDQEAFCLMGPFLELMAQEVNPKIIKLLMALENKCHLSFRLPLVPPNPQSIEKAERCKSALQMGL